MIELVITEAKSMLLLLVTIFVIGFASFTALICDHRRDRSLGLFLLTSFFGPLASTCLWSSPYPSLLERNVQRSQKQIGEEMKATFGK